jgi:hypothetical protein
VNLVLQVAKSVEEVSEDSYFSIAGDKNRHKAQLYFEFDARTLKKGSTVLVKSGVISQTGNVLNITVENIADLEILSTQIFTQLSPAELSWPNVGIKVEKSSPHNSKTVHRAAETEDRKELEASPKKGQNVVL